MVSVTKTERPVLDGALADLRTGDVLVICDLIRERIQAGLTAARARGRMGGKPKGLPPEAERTAYAAEPLYREQRLSAREIAEELGIAKSTLCAYLRHRGVPIGG